jgi:hypothetical protein
MKKQTLICGFLMMIFGLAVVPALSEQVYAQQVKLKSSVRPKGKSKSINSSVLIPKDWVYIYDRKKGYGFSVPGDSIGESTTNKGIDLMSITTPAPLAVDIFVLVFKDKRFTKDDVMEVAVTFLEELGQKVTPGNIVGESEDYLVIDADTVHPELGKGKLRIMVATDITDNYVMILGADDKTFKASEKLIDQIWGSFEMWSGGASGVN